MQLLFAFLFLGPKFNPNSVLAASSDSAVAKRLRQLSSALAKPMVCVPKASKNEFLGSQTSLKPMKPPPSFKVFAFLFRDSVLANPQLLN